MLRIDPRPGNAGSYTIPDVSPPTRFGTAVWAYGLRNPFRFSFDRGTGDLVIGDVGQGAREEIDWARTADGRGRGADYGWPAARAPCPGRGTATRRRATSRRCSTTTQAGPRAVTGGYVVRDPGLPDAAGPLRLRGHLRRRRALASCWRSRAPPTTGPTGLPARDLLVSFGEDACGHLYVVSLNGTRRPHPGRRAGPVPDPAARAGRCPRGPPARPPAAPRPPDRTSPRVQHPRSRARAASAGARRRGSSLTATENCRVTISARLGGTRLKRVRTPLRGRPPHDRAAAADGEGGQAHPPRAAAPPAGDDGRRRRPPSTRPATPAACSGG